ncbi:MAG: protease modulator HflC [Dongiaceae bacterium]
MNRTVVIALAVAAITILVVGLSSTFTVYQWQHALVLQFGDPKRAIDEPGLHFKLPFVQNVVYFEKRVLNLDALPEEVPTADQKQVVVEAYAKYRIIDPLRFYQSVQSEEFLLDRLGPIINAQLREALGEVEMAQILTDQRASFMRDITNAVNIAGGSFGIEVLDVRMKRVDLPEENSQAIFRRMQTQREQEARRFRAEGQRDAQTIRAEADKRHVVIIADARRQSEILRGEGDAGATRIYNDAYGQDVEFFDFYRSMQALERGLSGDTTTYVGPPEGDFFRFFGDLDGGEPAPTPAP